MHVTTLPKAMGLRDVVLFNITAVVWGGVLGFMDVGFWFARRSGDRLA